MPDQNRHPAIRFVLHDNAGRPVRSCCVGIKGGGLRCAQAELSCPLKEPWRGWRVPIYRHRPPKSGEHLPSTHDYWGGALESEVATEFSTTLGLRLFLEKRLQSRRVPVAIPLDAGVYETLPVWKEGALRWLLQQEYFNEVLNQPLGSGLGYLRTVFPSEVRFLQLADHIFLRDVAAPTAICALQKRINEGLEFFYWLHGEGFREPHGNLKDSQGSLGAAEILRYLKAVHDSNHTAAERIRRKVAEPLIASLALVHREGGHFGGLAVRRGGQQFGALSGGPHTIRNLDLSGTIHDVDGNVLVPGHESLDGERFCAEKLRHPFMRRADLFVLRDTLYWLDKILYGADLPHGTEAFEYTGLGKPNSITRFGKEDLWAAKLSLRDLGLYSEKGAVDHLKLLAREEDRLLYASF